MGFLGGGVSGCVNQTSDGHVLQMRRKGQLPSQVRRPVAAGEELRTQARSGAAWLQSSLLQEV